MHRRLIAVLIGFVTAVVLAMPAQATPDDPPPGGTGAVECPTFRCGINATDPGNPGGGGGDTTQPIDTGERGSVGPPGPARKPDPVPTAPLSGIPCTYQRLPADQLPEAGSDLWEGHDPSEGWIEVSPCADNVPGYALFRFVPNAAVAAPPAAPPPPPDPAVVAQSAYRKFLIPDTEVQFGPDPERIAVNMKTWLWVGNSTDLGEESANAGAVTVTAHARVVRVEWSPGEPAGKNPATGALGGTADTVSCTVVDQAPAADGSGEPGCSYVYKLRSLADRTQGKGTWTLTATAVWEVEWTATGVAPGQAMSGVIRPPAQTTAAQVRVGEWRTVGGFGSGG